MSLDRALSRFVANMGAGAHAERTKDATDWVAPGLSPSPDQVQAFRRRPRLRRRRPGSATAFGMVSKATTAMQVAARQAMREQREAAESKSAT